MAAVTDQRIKRVSTQESVCWLVGIPLSVAATGYPAIYLMMPPSDEMKLLVSVIWIVGSAVGGLLVGVVQWVALRRWVASVGWWVPATAAGWAAAGLFSAGCGAGVAQNFMLVILLFPITSLLGGVFVGIAQWSMLRHEYRWAGWWLVANVIGSVVGSIVGYWVSGMTLIILDGANPFSKFDVWAYLSLGPSNVLGLTGALCGAIAGGIYALATWIVLKTIPRPDHTVESQPVQTLSAVNQ